MDIKCLKSYKKGDHVAIYQTLLHTHYKDPVIVVLEIPDVGRF